MPDAPPLESWIGRTETRTDMIAPTPVAALSATLDRDDPPPRAGDPLPPLWHWMYFLDIRRRSELGRDGHPDKGGFLPPVPLPRRMWAGGRLRWHHPLRVGEEVERESRILSITEKQGRTGPLAFVLVRHEFRNAAGLALTEEHDIVYRGDPQPGDPVPPPKEAPAGEWSRETVPNETMLFRYSALTFNGHRIHYDYRYATEVEGYAGLVFHGPLAATLLIDLVRRERPEASITAFDFRSVRPVCVTGAAWTACGEPAADGKTVKLWGRDADGFLTTDGVATLG